jgi:SAM-dependent methyltransferase
MCYADDYLSINRRLWNDWAEKHVDSPFYDMESFINGRNSLNPVELQLLGDVAGKRILHLQCHFGQDTLSLARMGADVTGADFSDSAIEYAVELAARLHVEAEFMCCDVYALPTCLMKKFDIVFTSYGTVGWLPDLERWAKVIAHFLADGGRFVIADFHPFVWMYDDAIEKITYSYFNTGPIVETVDKSYAAATAPRREAIGWNHPLSEIMSGLLKSGLSIDSFSEYDYAPYKVFRNMTENEKGKFSIAGLEGRFPLVYAMVAKKGD